MSKGDAEQQMMREIEAGIRSDDSDVEFNVQLLSGSGGAKAFSGDDADDASDGGSGSEEEMKLLGAVGSDDDGAGESDDGEARVSKRAKKGRGIKSVFASAVRVTERARGREGQSGGGVSGPTYLLMRVLMRLCWAPPGFLWAATTRPD